MRLSVWEVAQKAYEVLRNIGGVVDITALNHTKISSKPPKSIKIILKTKKDNEIPNTININNVKVAFIVE
ncbi:hypothetical protein AYI69_g1622 [Smittium culicis]|uniref:Uncharacterized protein n=1 Tax=Smittium culicis TaxID=133412 RepID=A0A1R1YPX7_9FUNG|nr:hypothetical protein AYI69_g1622 [Smittium culicis]